MKKYILSIFLLALPLLASAYDCQVDGIYYNLNSDEKTAEVTYQGTDQYGYPKSYYSGSVTITDKFTYDGVDYSVTSIGNNAFYYCSDLTSVSIPNSVTTIESYAFCKCSGLTSLIIPNSVTTIGSNAFSNCSGLTSVTIPNSVTRIGLYVFSDCSGLTSVTIPNSVTGIESSAFRGCSGLTSVSIPNSVTSIGEHAFYECTGLTSVTIPNSVTNIGRYAFEGCSSLTSVKIPNSVNNIRYKAFANCYKLDRIYCYALKIPSTDKDAFINSGIQFATLYVFADMVKAFKTVAPWSEFGTITSFEESGIDPNPDPDNPKCATPTISYANKELSFSCATNGVEYHYTITDSDIKSDVASSISLSATYEISVYASKEGYNNSDVATATLVWTNAIFTETTETSISAKAVTESFPVLISAQGGTVTVKCEQEGQPVAVYTADGKALGNSIVSGGHSTIATPLQKGQVAIVNVGNKSVKIIMK